MSIFTTFNNYEGILPLHNLNAAASTLEDDLQTIGSDSDSDDDEGGDADVFPCGSTAQGTTNWLSPYNMSKQISDLAKQQKQARQQEQEQDAQKQDSAAEDMTGDTKRRLLLITIYPSFLYYLDSSTLKSTDGDLASQPIFTYIRRWS